MSGTALAPSPIMPDIPPALVTALDRIDAARSAVPEARCAAALAALDIARTDGGRGDVYARAAALLGWSERTLHRALAGGKVTGIVTSAKSGVTNIVTTTNANDSASLDAATPSETTGGPNGR